MKFDREQVDKDIAMAENYARKTAGNVAVFDEYCSVFVFGTENQEGINKIIDYKGKEVLTVASSADQYVSALYYGACDVKLFDINRFTYYMSYLKIAGIKCFSYQEFLDFFIPYFGNKNNNKFLDIGLFSKLALSLPDDVAYFWSMVLKLFKKYGLGNFTFLKDKSFLKENIIVGMPFYEKKEEFNRLKGILQGKEYPQFYLGDLRNLKGIIQGRFDIVYLSNIIESMVCEELRRYSIFCYMNEDKVEEYYVMMALEQVMGMLRDDGTILMSYRSNSNLELSADVLYHNDYFEPNLVSAKKKNIDDLNRKDSKTDIVLTYTPSKNGKILR